MQDPYRIRSQGKLDMSHFFDPEAGTEVLEARVVIIHILGRVVRPAPRGNVVEAKARRIKPEANV